MATVRFVHSGSFDNTERFLKAVQKIDIGRIAAAQAKIGVRALANATPTDTGLAAKGWSYEVRQNGGGVSIVWTNSDIENEFPVVIMLCNTATELALEVTSRVVTSSTQQFDRSLTRSPRQCGRR
jgi:hypothetical protein